MLHPNKLSQKLLILIAILLVTTILGIGLIFLYVLLSVGRFPSLNSNFFLEPQNAHMLKPILALNHLTSFVLTAVLYNKYISSSSGKYISFNIDIDWAMLTKCLLFMLCCYPLAISLTMVINSINIPSGLSSMSEDQFSMISKLINGSSIYDLMTSIIVVALIPSIGEEMFFRGILQKLFSDHMNIFYAIGLTSFIFAALHLDPIGLGFKFTLGYALGVIYYYSKNILIPIFIHFINNALPFLFSYLYKLNTSQANENNIMEAIIIGMVFIPLTWITFCKLKNHYKHG